METRIPGVMATAGRLILGAVLLVIAACSSTPPPAELTTPTPWDQCQAIMAQGVFTEKTLRCFPEVAEAIEVALCQDHFGRHDDANKVGFGYGTRVFDVELLDPRSGGEFSNLVPFSVEEIYRWRREHCSGTEPRAAPDWQGIRARLPQSLAGPWRACSEQMALASQQRIEVDRGVSCLLVGSYDLSGESEHVDFQATFFTSNWFDYSTRLIEDVSVEGADCGDEAWQKGSLLRLGRPRVLSCQRQGRSAVMIRVVTAAGSCERHLPELVHEPWQVLCDP